MEELDSSVLTLEQDGAVATLWLDRPDARNAMGHAFWADLPRAMRAISAGSEIRAVVIAGRGPHFSVGLDLKEMGGSLTGSGSGTTAGTAAPPAHELSPAARAATTRAAVLTMQAAMTAVAECPKPVIAAVHGYCIG
ncbi:MAG: enoyl-CoA hydratase-related protein, partial [Acidimicrobiales bacterium]